MAINKIPVKISLRKNENAKSPAYGKFYPVVENEETISTRALLEHIMSHGLGYPRSVVQGVLTQVAECLTELLLQGQPVKLDGFGTFKLSAISDQVNGVGGIAQLTPGLDVRPYIKGLRLVVIPDNTDLDKLTSASNLSKAAITLVGVVEKADAGQTSTGNAKTERIITPLDVYIEKNTPEPEP